MSSLSQKASPFSWGMLLCTHTLAAVAVATASEERRRGRRNKTKQNETQKTLDLKIHIKN